MVKRWGGSDNSQKGFYFKKEYDKIALCHGSEVLRRDIRFNYWEIKNRAVFFAGNLKNYQIRGTRKNENKNSLLLYRMWQ